MPSNTPPSARNQPGVFTSLTALALAAAALAGASLGSVTGGAAQERPRTLGLGRVDAILAESRRHTQALERIEQAIGRLQTEIAQLNARNEAAGSANRDAANAAPDSPGQGTPSLNGPEFDLGPLRAAFDTEPAAPRSQRKLFRPRPRRAVKGSPGV